MWAILSSKLLIYGSIAVMVFGAGWKLRDYQADSEKVALQEDQISELERQRYVFNQLLAVRDKAAVDLQKKLIKLREDKTEAQTERAREYAKPDYTKCVVPDDGVRLLNKAIAGANKAAAVN